MSKSLQLENEELRAKLADRDAKIQSLAQDLAALKKYVHKLLASRKTGHLIPEGQGVLFPDPPTVVLAEDESTPDAIEDPAVETEESPVDDNKEEDQGDPAPKPRRPSRKVDTSSLPCEERHHELPEEERICPDTGLPLVKIGEKLFDEIDYQRARVLLVRHHQAIYGLAPEQAEDRKVDTVTAPMPPRPIEGCVASAMLLAWLLVQKYANHLPLYRQEKIFMRDGLLLSRKTLCDWTLNAAEALRPIVDHLMAEVRAGPVMQLDDTPVMCQGGKGRKHFQAYLWTFVNPEVDGVVYRFTSGRSSDLIAAELGSFAGTLVGDGYSGNRAAANKVDGEIALAGCWAHTTRKFRDALSEAPGTAQLFREDIKCLYAIEREADQANLDPDERAELRQRKSKPVLVRLLSRARHFRDDYSDAGVMAGAMGYLRRQRKPLLHFLKDGRIPLDNNACERSIRPIAIGRRNWLFAGSPRGGKAAAVVYSVVASCALAEIDVVDYIADVLVRVATHPSSRIAELLPRNWAKTVAADSTPELALT